MKPLAPEVVGPLSVCSKVVQIRGNINGATIRIRVNNRESVHADAKSDAFYDIGASLHVGDTVIARQEFEGENSEFSLPVLVQDAPEQLSALTIHTTLHECGRAIFVTGGVPGARVRAQINDGPAGEDVIVSGFAAFGYDPGLSEGERLSLIQNTCNGLSATQLSQRALTFPSPLPAPVIHEPLIECQNTITIGGVVEGAFVELRRNGGDWEQREARFTFSLSQEMRRIKALKKGDVLEVRQGLICNKTKKNERLEAISPSASVKVQGFEALRAPSFLSTPCPGTTYVTLSRLIPGARVVFEIDEQEWGQTDAPDSVCTFTIPPLPQGVTLKAYMVLCDQRGPAATITVSSEPGVLEGVRVSDLYACAAFVFVVFDGSSDPLANYLVYLTNSGGQHISAYHNVIGSSKLIPISPGLTQGDEIIVHVMSCGGQWTKFGPFTATLGSAQAPEFAEPVISGRNYVPVLSLHAGAVIDVYVNNEWRGSDISRGSLAATKVYVGEKLVTGETVHGTQTLCGRTSRPSKRITVQKPHPEVPQLLRPSEGAKNVSVRPFFRWKDPATNLENRAESYTLKVMKSGDTIWEIPDLTTPDYDSGTGNASLDYMTSYLWKVISKNSTGNAHSTANLFQTEARPRPEKEPQAELRFRTETFFSDPPGFPKDQIILVKIEVANQGNEASLPYTVRFDFKENTIPQRLIYTEPVEMPSLAAGAVTWVGVLFGWPGFITRVSATLIVDGPDIEAWQAIFT